MERRRPEPHAALHVMASGAEFSGVAIGNFDADPGREVLASGNGLAWYDAPADVTQAWTATPVAEFGGAVVVVLAVADLDGDGDTDVAASAHPEAEVRVFLNEGATWSEVEVANDYAASFINIGDIDGDRRYDLVTSTYTATATAWPGGRTWSSHETTLHCVLYRVADRGPARAGAGRVRGSPARARAGGPAPGDRQSHADRAGAAARADALPIFLAGAESEYGLSLHLAVITTDMGTGELDTCGPGDGGRFQATPRGSCSGPQGNFLVSDVDDYGVPVTNFSGELVDALDCILPDVGQGCAYGQPVAAIQAALDGSVSENDGFLRPDAVLVVLVVTGGGRLHGHRPAAVRSGPGRHARAADAVPLLRARRQV